MSSFINIGVLTVNTVTENGSVSAGDNAHGDVQKHFKSNQGFGVVFGNGDLIPGNLNFVCDNDLLDSHNMQNLASPSINPAITGIAT